jgi:hypothetical protein
MTSATKSYAQSLRIIGQALEILRINAFALEKKGEKYIVHNWEPSFLKSITDKVWGTGDSDQMPFTPQESSDLLVYTSSDTKRLETDGRSRRGSNQNQDIYNVSSGLRVLGDYLDGKRAVAFDIWWSIESIRVKYETPAGGPKEANFTVQNLQELGVGMHVRRSSRQFTK